MYAIKLNVPYLVNSVVHVQFSHDINVYSDSSTPAFL